jgi:hypothetical protein
MISKRCRTQIGDDLFTIVKRLVTRDVGPLPVVTRKRPECTIGLITRSGLRTALKIARGQCAAWQEKSDLAHRIV